MVWELKRVVKFVAKGGGKRTKYSSDDFNPAGLCGACGECGGESATRAFSGGLGGLV